MSARAVGWLTRGKGRTLLEDAGRRGDACTLESLVTVLASLLRCPLSREQVLVRAVSLGLARTPVPGESTALAVQAASRLLLAGYHLPAQVEMGSLRGLCRHVREGRLVFAFRKGSEPRGIDEPEVLQVCSLNQEGPAEPWLLLREAGPHSEAGRYLSMAQFAHDWSAAHNLMLVAVPSWTDLPAQGTTFFAGSRGRDGTFHWDTAECDTDASGRIVRF